MQTYKIENFHAEAKTRSLYAGRDRAHAVVADLLKEVCAEEFIDLDSLATEAIRTNQEWIFLGVMQFCLSTKTTDFTDWMKTIESACASKSSQYIDFLWVFLNHETIHWPMLYDYVARYNNVKVFDHLSMCHGDECDIDLFVSTALRHGHDDLAMRAQQRLQCDAKMTTYMAAAAFDGDEPLFNGYMTVYRKTQMLNAEAILNAIYNAAWGWGMNKLKLETPYARIISELQQLLPQDHALSQLKTLQGICRSGNSNAGDLLQHIPENTEQYTLLLYTALQCGENARAYAEICIKHGAVLTMEIANYYGATWAFKYCFEKYGYYTCMASVNPNSLAAMYLNNLHAQK